MAKSTNADQGLSEHPAGPAEPPAPSATPIIGSAAPSPGSRLARQAIGAAIASMAMWIPFTQGILAFALSCLHIPMSWVQLIIRAALIGLPALGIVSGVRASAATVSQRSKGQGRGLASLAVGLNIIFLLLALGIEGVRLYVR